MSDVWVPGRTDLGNGVIPAAFQEKEIWAQDDLEDEEWEEEEEDDDWDDDDEDDWEDDEDWDEEEWEEDWEDDEAEVRPGRPDLEE